MPLEPRCFTSSAQAWSFRQKTDTSQQSGEMRAGAFIDFCLALCLMCVGANRPYGSEMLSQRVHRLTPGRILLAGTTCWMRCHQESPRVVMQKRRLLYALANILEKLQPPENTVKGVEPSLFQALASGRALLQLGGTPSECQQRCERTDLAREKGSRVNWVCECVQCDAG